jgi:hypothetical protein
VWRKIPHKQGSIFYGYISNNTNQSSEYSLATKPKLVKVTTAKEALPAYRLKAS